MWGFPVMRWHFFPNCAGYKIPAFLTSWDWLHVLDLVANYIQKGKRLSLHVSFLTLPTFNALAVAWKSSSETRSGQRLSVGICNAKSHCTYEESCLPLQHGGSKVELLTVCSFMLCRTDCCPPVTVHFKLSREGLTYHICSLNYYKVSTLRFSRRGVSNPAPGAQCSEELGSKMHRGIWLKVSSDPEDLD